MRLRPQRWLKFILCACLAGSRRAGATGRKLSAALGRAGLEARHRRGVERTIEAESLYTGGFVQYAADGRRLERAQGGPLRLFILGGAEQCDNVKALSQIEVL